MRLRHAYRVAVAAVREAAKRVTRSGAWRVVEKLHLQTWSRCAACGGATRLQVHHIQPFHLHPELELEPSNLLTLCMGPKECHLLVGHLGSWKRSNPEVVAYARALRKRVRP